MTRILSSTVTLILIILSLDSIAQNCSSISGTKNKDKGTETFGGLTNSQDHYSLLFQKQFDRKDTTVKPKYILLLNAATSVLLTDSLLKTQGTIELRLLDNSVVKLDNVIFSNNPLGFCCSLGFRVYLTEELAKIIATNPISTLSVLTLTTSFTDKRQKEQQKIINCLLNKH